MRGHFLPKNSSLHTISPLCKNTSAIWALCSVPLMTGLEEFHNVGKMAYYSIRVTGATHIHVAHMTIYPCGGFCSSEEVTYLADHCSSAVNLRLSESGHITADLHMDFPPMRSVLLDPYSGSVCPLSLSGIYTTHLKGHSK